MDNEIYVTLNEEEIHLDRKKMEFNEVTLNEYLEREALWYDYYGQKLAEAEYLTQRYELDYEVLFSQKFKEFKEEGGSDKFVEAKVICFADVIKAQEKVIAGKAKIKHLQQHLRAWDKSHDNAQSRGHMLRREMDKLSLDIYQKTDVEQRLDEIIGK